MCLEKNVSCCVFNLIYLFFKIKCRFLGRLPVPISQMTGLLKSFRFFFSKKKYFLYIRIIILKLFHSPKRLFNENKKPLLRFLKTILFFGYNNGSFKIK